jgi:hypothetical protein
MLAFDLVLARSAARWRARVAWLLALAALTAPGGPATPKEPERQAAAAAHPVRAVDGDHAAATGGARRPAPARKCSPRAAR